MKRTGFKRRQIERRTPAVIVAPGAFRLARPVDAEVRAVPKDEPVRSEPYQRLVAGLPCVICGIAGYSQAAHGSEAKGMGLKACDLTLFPACCDRPGVRGCHSQLDQGALFSKAVRRQLEPVWAADTRRRIRAMGLWPKNLPPPADEPAAPINAIKTGAIEE